MTIQTVGAPADSEEDPAKKKVTAPPILKQAEEAIAQNIGAPASDADRERIFAYRAEPFLKQTQKTTENLSKYYEQQGLRFSTERRDMIAEKVGEIGRQMGESVMVPQLEREKADQQAWAGLGINLGTAQANIALQDRQQSLAETNAALERAAVQARETGVFKDPVTGMNYETLAAQAQKFGQGIQERQTTLMETNGAYERAQSRGTSTGIYIDPVTGMSSETLDKQRLELDRTAQRAVATGWWEEEATFEREKLLAAAGADTDNGLGEPPPGSTVPPPAAGEGEDPDTVKERATTNVAELDFIANRLPAYQRDTGASMAVLQTIVTELGAADAEALMDRLLAGEPLTVGELRNLTLTKHQSAPAWAAVQDMVTAEGTSDESRVWLIGKRPAADQQPTNPPTASGAAPAMNFESWSQTVGDEFQQLMGGGNGRVAVSGRYADLVEKYQVPPDVAQQVWDRVVLPTMNQLPDRSFVGQQPPAPADISPLWNGGPVVLPSLTGPQWGDPAPAPAPTPKTSGISKTKTKAGGTRR